MNTSRSAQYFLKAMDTKLDNKIVTMGSIGDDSSADFIIDSLNKEGIHYYISQSSQTSTGTCAVAVVNIDRTGIAILDACHKYKQDHMKEVLEKPSTKNFLCFYSTAFFIKPAYDSLKMMALYALENNKIFGFNFAAEFIYKYYKKETLDILEYSDFIFCNKSESIACSEFFFNELGIEHSTEDTIDNLKKISMAIANFKLAKKTRPRVMVITNSEKPVVVSVGAFNG